MKSNNQIHTKISHALREILLEASEDELQEALSEVGENFDSLATSGQVVAQLALADADKNYVQDLHRGLSTLIQMLRRRDRISIDELSRRARVDASELHRIEIDPTFDPNPRTIYQLEQYFALPSRSLVVLSGAVRVDNDVRTEAMRFAANSENISELSREERNLLSRFVKFLRDHTDR